MSALLLLTFDGSGFRGARGVGVAMCSQRHRKPRKHLLKHPGILLRPLHHLRPHSRHFLLVHLLPERGKIFSVQCQRVTS